jgi:hypothetical protein
MNWKGFGRKQSWHNFKTKSLQGLRDIMKTSIRIAGLWPEIPTRDLPITKQECEPLDHDVWCCAEDTNLFTL